MLLQPILENAVNHGIFHKAGAGFIEIRFEKIDSGFVVRISDDGPGWDNVQQMLQDSLSKPQLSSTKILQEKIELLNQSQYWNISFEVTTPSTMNGFQATGTCVKFVIKKGDKPITSVVSEIQTQKPIAHFLTHKMPKS